MRKKKGTVYKIASVQDFLSLSLSLSLSQSINQSIIPRWGKLLSSERLSLMVMDFVRECPHEFDSSLFNESSSSLEPNSKSLSTVDMMLALLEISTLSTYLVNFVPDE